jgi:hypothetical protein
VIGEYAERSGDRPGGYAEPGADRQSHGQHGYDSVGAEPAVDAQEPAEVRTGHPAVDAELRAMANAVNLPPDDQIAQYEATHQVLRETLATIDEG